MIQRIKPQGYFEIYCDQNESPIWGRRDSIFDNLFHTEEQSVNSPFFAQFATQPINIQCNNLNIILFLASSSIKNIQNSPSFVYQSNQPRINQSLSSPNPPTWIRFDYRQQQSEHSRNQQYAEQNGSISEEQIKFSLENLTLNRSSSYSLMSFESCYDGMKIESSKMKEFGYNILRSNDNDEFQGEICQIISIIKDEQKQEDIMDLNQGREEAPIDIIDDDEEISSVKADVDMVHQQSQSLKIKISLGNTSIITSEKDQQLFKGSDGKLFQQQDHQNKYEGNEEYAQIKKELNLKLFSTTKANQYQEQTKTTAEIEQSQILDMTAISYQQKTLKDEKKLKKEKKQKKVKKQKNEKKKATKQKRKYTQRKLTKEKKPYIAKKSELTKQSQLEQIKMIQELLDQNFTDQDKISTQPTDLEAKQNLVQVQPKESKLKEIQGQFKLLQDLAPLTKAADKTKIIKATKTFKNRQTKPKASKKKEGNFMEENQKLKLLLQDKQNIQPADQQSSSIQHLPTKPENQNLYKCDIDDCVRKFSTKQALSLHKSRTHKTKSKSQISIKKAEHQSYKQIYKQIYPQDTRYNPIKLAELKEGMKLQS